MEITADFDQNKKKKTPNVRNSDKNKIKMTFEIFEVKNVRN